MYANEMGAEPNFQIHARDGTAMIVLRRNTREAAQRKAEELRDMGWFDVEIVELSEAGPAPANPDATKSATTRAA